MDFGISLDASAVTQRHCLEDSDEEEEESETTGITSETFTVPDRRDEVVAVSNLIIALGQPAVVFAKSYLDLEPLNSCTILTDKLTAFKDKYFSTGVHRQGNTYTVSEGFDVKCIGSNLERCVLCSHEQPLSSQHCNLWCSKV